MTQLHHVIIALGTNTDGKANMNQAKALLGRLLELPIFTRTIQTDAIDGSEKYFYNSLVWAYTTHRLAPLLQSLKRIEKQCGDSKQLRAEGIVNMDVDLLLYDDVKLHEADWGRSYIKELLKELKWDNT